ncbi:Protein FecR [Pseudomonas reidholzensis]|uniref:FecR domain-containing protein n=1 Tax=Pseudomonas reidholzensis TaxID=1785162 RepID=UPI0039EE265C
MLDREILQAAATWYVQLSAAPASEAERRGWQTWLEQDARHAQAWARVEKLQRQLGALPHEVALPTLVGVRAKRRAVAKVLGLLLAAGATGWGLQTLEPLASRMAQFRTAKGERRHLRLAEGGTLDMNTQTSVDIHYSDALREIRLHHGEILVQTAADPAGRPFVVHTPQGSIRALGTRFSVRSEGQRSAVQVIEHAVELRPAQAPTASLRLEAGQRAGFDSARLGAPEPGAKDSDAWLRGMLMAVEWRLGDLVGELQRYRSGRLVCSDDVAALRVSGGFRLDDTDTVLENLQASLPITVHYLTRYWVRIEAA